MAQRPTADYPIDPNVTSGTDLSGILNRFQDAIESGNSGSSRPAYLEAGGLWVKTGDPMRLYFYDGTQNNELYNTTDGIVGVIDDGTVDGQIMTWNENQKEWKPDSAITINELGNATFKGNVNCNRAIFNDIAGIYAGKGSSNAPYLLPIGSSLGLESQSISIGRPASDGPEGLWKDGNFSGTVSANLFVDANGAIISAFTMVQAFRKIKNAVADETTVEGIKESLTNVLGGLIEEFESIGTQES